MGSLCKFCKTAFTTQAITLAVMHKTLFIFTLYVITLDVITLYKISQDIPTPNVTLDTDTLEVITRCVITQDDIILYVITFNSTRRYGPLCGPTFSSCRGHRPSAEAFFALQAKKEHIMRFWPIFWKFLVPSSNLGNF